jgi:multisubunit Na+/H+ antiporter MnhB subunit
MPEIMVLLILLMIVGALVAIETPNLLYSVISVGAVGFLLSIAFLFLSAPDLAITQIVVEVITLVLLLRATIRPEVKAVSGHREFFGMVVTVAMVLILALFSVRMFVDFPEFGQPVMDRFADAPSNTYLQEGLEKTGAANIVTAVLLDFRAYDTLGEATVLFCAVLGALAILRRKARKRPEEADEEEGT